MSMPGRIYARLLPPIIGSAADGMTREAMSTHLRKKMLEAIKQFPRDAGDSLTWKERFYNIIAIIMLIAVEYWLYVYPCQYVMNKYQISYMQLLGYIYAFHVLITIRYYILYVVYMKNEFCDVPVAESSSPKLN